MNFWERLLEELVTVTESTFSTMLALQVHPGATACSLTEYRRAVSVTISGVWNGCLTLRCPDTVTRAAAERLFGADNQINEAEIEDALRELANIIGGNLKAVMPEEGGFEVCKLSTPVMKDLIGENIDDEHAATIPFNMAGECFEVSVPFEAQQQLNALDNLSLSFCGA